MDATKHNNQGQGCAIVQSAIGDRVQSDSVRLNSRSIECVARVTRSSARLRESQLRGGDTGSSASSSVPSTSRSSQSQEGRSAHGNLAKHLLLNESNTLTLLYRGKEAQCLCCCGDSFERMPKLRSHLASCRALEGILSPSISQYKCAKCNRLDEKFSAIAVHYAFCMGELEHSRPLTEAESAAESRSSPASEVSGESSTSHECVDCGRLFKSKAGWGQHRRHRHSDCLYRDAPASKVPRWTESEHAMLIEAEARLAIEGMADDRAVTSLVSTEILKRMRAECPDFNRSLDSIQGRRKWGGEDHLEQVLVKKRKLLDDLCPSASSDDQVPTPSEDSFESSQGNESMGTCDCIVGLQDAIDRRLTESTINLSMRKFLVGVKENLEGFNVEAFKKLSEKRSTGSQRTPSPQDVTHRKERGTPGKAKIARRANERRIFETQGLKRCLEHLRNPADVGLCGKPTVDLFKGIFEDAGELVDGEPYKVKETVSSPHLIHSAISKDEVAMQRSRLQKCTAPGPDGVRVEDLMGYKSEDLACLFNIFLLHEDVPGALKVNKTTLIAKTDKPGVGDWRPITLSSIIDRLFAKVLEFRLSRVVDLNACQRGFIANLDGCGENITTYGGLLRYSRTCAKPLVVVSLDLAKAFDSVRYGSINRSLKRVGLDERSVRLLMNLCHGHKTNIKFDEGTSAIELKKGVRQGWPLSPLLFLIVVDEVLCRLDDVDGVKVESPSREVCSIPGAAFADDIILYSSSVLGMKRHLGKVVSWCDARGMRINPSKSTAACFQRVPRKKKVVLTPIELPVKGVVIPNVGDSYERVLGVHMHNSGKVDHKFDKLTKDLDLVKASKLRPSQKVTMIRDCLIPMIKFRLVYGFATRKACVKVDSILRSAVRKIMHLPKYFNVLGFYISKKDGGMGIPRLADDVLLAQASLALRMSSSVNDSTRLLADTRVLAKVGRRYEKYLGDLALTESAIETVKDKVKSERVSLISNTSQGLGWSLFRNAPRMFLDDPRARKWTDKDAIEAVKIRSNVAMTRALYKQTSGRALELSVVCRACNHSVETLAHILSKCPNTQANRVNRHDHVCRYLGSWLKDFKERQGETSDTEILIESSFKILANEIPGQRTDQLVKPDLVVITTDRVVIIEVSVVFEYDDHALNSLEQVHRDKCNKYKGLCKVLAQRFDRTCKIKTMIVGCRGGWIASNDKVFADLGTPKLSDLDRNSLVERAVRGSIITYKRFFAATREPLIHVLG